MAWQLRGNANGLLGPVAAGRPSSSRQATLTWPSRSQLRSQTGQSYGSSANMGLMQPGMGLRTGYKCPRAVAARAGWLQSVFGGSTAAVVVPEQEATHAVDEVELQSLIKARGNTPLLVVFTATWCGPCRMLYNNLQRVSAGLGPGSARIVSVDVEDCPEIASRLKVQKLPTLLFLGPHDGRPAVRMQGPVRDAVLVDVLTNKCKNLGDDMQRAMLL